MEEMNDGICTCECFQKSGIWYTEQKRGKDRILGAGIHIVNMNIIYWITWVCLVENEREIENFWLNEMEWNIILSDDYINACVDLFVEQRKTAAAATVNETEIMEASRKQREQEKDPIQMIDTTMACFMCNSPSV